MLVELKVKDFAIIDSIQITFKEGFNILSGETGAGKSVLLKSLALLMGEKALSDTVRTGAKTASIEGLFDLSHREDLRGKLEELGIDGDEDTLVVRRMISAQGKSRVYLNGSLSALGSLRDIVAPLIEVTGQAAPLIEMTGQHDNRHLQSKSYHLDILDDYTGSHPLRQKVQTKYNEVIELENEIESLESDARMKAQRLDFLIYQRDEIRDLNLQPLEEEELESQVARLKNAHRLIEFSNGLESRLYSEDDSVLVSLHKILQQGQELSNVDSQLPKRLDNLLQAKNLIEEVVYDIRAYSQDLSVNPVELNEKEDRLSQLRRLQKKHGESVNEILVTLEKLEEEINTLEHSDEKIKELKDKKNKATNKLEQLADELHQRRFNGAHLLSKSINDELLDLNMKGLTFNVNVKSLVKVGSTGSSDVEFMTQTSKKDTLRPLTKFASGGELSRILLSIKRVVGQSEKPRTYLFDEVDAGVSGLTAEKVGRKLKSIAQGQQVICVTHLPQVASFADSHFYIQKNPSKTGMQMEIIELSKSKKVNEIARLISGEKITKTSLAHAKQLLEESH